MGFTVCIFIYMYTRVLTDLVALCRKARRFFIETECVCLERFKATLMDDAAMQRALKRIAHEILEKNNGCENLCIIGIKRRGISVAQIIAKNIADIEGILVPVGTLDITFYRDDLSQDTEDPVLHRSDIPVDLTGKTVVLCDDVLYTGRTVRAAMDALKDHGRAAGIQLAVLVDRGHRELPIRGDYVGKNVPTGRNEYISVRIPPFDENTAVEIYETDGSR